MLCKLDDDIPFEVGSALACGFMSGFGAVLNRCQIKPGESFAVCGCGGENFGSLSEPQLEKYLRQFELPECFFRFRGEMIALPFAPLKETEREL